MITIFSSRRNEEMKSQTGYFQLFEQISLVYYIDILEL